MMNNSHSLWYLYITYRIPGIYTYSTLILTLKIFTSSALKVLARKCPHAKIANKHKVPVTRNFHIMNSSNYETVNISMLGIVQIIKMRKFRYREYFKLSSGMDFWGSEFECVLHCFVVTALAFFLSFFAYSLNTGFSERNSTSYNGPYHVYSTR